jgi:hypothetical protein
MASARCCKRARTIFFFGKTHHKTNAFNERVSRVGEGHLPKKLVGQSQGRSGSTQAINFQLMPINDISQID